MIIESLHFKNQNISINELQEKINSGYYDLLLHQPFLTLTNEGFVIVNTDKTITSNIAIDLSSYVEKEDNKSLSTNDLTNELKDMILLANTHVNTIHANPDNYYEKTAIDDKIDELKSLINNNSALLNSLTDRINELHFAEETIE